MYSISSGLTKSSIPVAYTNKNNRMLAETATWHLMQANRALQLELHHDGKMSPFTGRERSVTDCGVMELYNSYSISHAKQIHHMFTKCYQFSALFSPNLILTLAHNSYQSERVSDDMCPLRHRMRTITPPQTAAAHTT